MGYLLSEQVDHKFIFHVLKDSSQNPLFTKILMRRPLSFMRCTFSSNIKPPSIFLMKSILSISQNQTERHHQILSSILNIQYQHVMYVVSKY